LDVETLRRLWRAYLPVRMIARDLGRTPRQIEAMARQLGLAHRDQAAVEHAGRLRGTACALRRAREASEELFPLAMNARGAAALAASRGVAWSGRRGDLSVLNAALEGAGQRPVYVPFRELRP
jgi:hypothetical protein